METAIALFAGLLGFGIAFIWTMDIVKGDKLDLSRGRLRAREPGTDALLLPHWIAEYATATALLVGAIGHVAAASWAWPLLLVALGALFYTSTNSLGWALARKERLPYAVPMLVGAVGSLASLMALLLA